jgi:hypothetical protein
MNTLFQQNLKYYKYENCIRKYYKHKGLVFAGSSKIITVHGVFLIVSNLMDNLHFLVHRAALQAHPSSCHGVP